MDKNAIKKYAVWARRELISRVSQKAQQFGITEKNIVDAAADSVNDYLLSVEEKKQRQALIGRIKADGYEQVVESVAYTWFNRFIALRFMEVNGYLPGRVRVFTDENGVFKPQILTEAIRLEMDGLDMRKVYAYKETSSDEALYKYLLITQCNALSSVLPGMFQRIDDYTELLFPDNLLRDGSVLEQMITLISEEDWLDQVQIIGWLYQYYNTDPKDKVFADLKKNIKISKENIPAATQLFTPDWIVRYMVENSLGRLWTEGHPDGELKANWKYYLEEAQQEPEVEAQLAEIRREYAALKPEEIRCIDPCMGSGHILVYMFDVLMQIYEAYGYTARDAVRSIVENNLYGLDIDDRAAQLAYCAVMMKARQYDSRFFSRGVQPHIYAICESNGISAGLTDYFCGGDEKLKADMASLVSELHDAKEYGSILNITPVDFDALYERFDALFDEISMYKQKLYDELLPLVQVAQTLAQKYDVVVTNPPYMGSSGMGAKLSEYVKKNYSDSKSDLFAVFMERTDTFVVRNRFTSLITMESWMFLSSFEKLRQKVNQTKTIINMVHMPYLGKGGTSLGINFGTAAVIMKKGYVPDYTAQYEYTVYYECDVSGIPLEFPTKNERWKTARQSDFSKIPGSPVAYWVSNHILDTFSKQSVGDVVVPRHGLATSDNSRFLKLWHEVCLSKTSLFTKCDYTKKWFPMNKGGAYRKWYGNLDWVINYENNGQEIKKFATELYKSASRTIQNTQFYFLEGITWSALTSGSLSFRWTDVGAIFGSGAHCAFATESDNMLYGLALLNGKISSLYLSIMSPTLNTNVDDIRATPLIIKDKINVVPLVHKCIEISKTDWDSFETSWDFQRHPLIGSYSTVADAYANWHQQCTTRFNTLKANEEALNRIFIDIYGLQDELTPEVEDKDVTVHYICDSKETAPDSLKSSNYLLTKRDVVKSLISYAVGCMFGRYSLDVDGLAYAGGEWDQKYCRWMTFFNDDARANENIDENGYLIEGGWAGSSMWKYDGIRANGKWITATYPPDTDNIIPICDDEYFDDDIVGRFVKFIETVYGRETLEENLRFIADALGGSGQPRDVLRSYFLNDFYADHLKIYQKRPIYWLFDSGKKNGFKALIYMHRYAPDTIARIRTDYVHEQQARYHTALADLERRVSAASGSERVRLIKQLSKMQDQIAETRVFEEKIHHLADRMIPIDLDDGVKHNYEIFKDVLAPIK